MRRSDGGRLFHMYGAATENARWPRLVLVLTTVAAPLVAERRRLLFLSAFVKWTKSQRYGGQSWRCILWTRVAILNVVRWRTGSQWSFFIAGVMWALCFRSRTRRAAVFWKRCSGAIVDAGRLTSTELQLSMRARTSAVTRCFITFWDTTLRSWKSRRRRQ